MLGLPLLHDLDAETAAAIALLLPDDTSDTTPPDAETLFGEADEDDVIEDPAGSRAVPELGIEGHLTDKPRGG